MVYAICRENFSINPKSKNIVIWYDIIDKVIFWDGKIKLEDILRCEFSQKNSKAMLKGKTTNRCNFVIKKKESIIEIRHRVA